MSATDEARTALARRREEPPTATLLDLIERQKPGIEAALAEASETAMEYRAHPTREINIALDIALARFTEART